MPQHWHRMEDDVTRTMFKYNLSDSSNISDIHYKIRMYFFNNSFIESNWYEYHKNSNCNLCEILSYSFLVFIFIIFSVFSFILYKNK